MMANATPDLDAVGGSTTEIAKIDADEIHTIALKSDGTVWTWGRDDWGALGHYYEELYPRKVQLPTELGKAIDVGIGYYHAAALLDHSTPTDNTDNTVWTWGANDNSGLGTPNIAIGDETIDPQQVIVADTMEPLRGITQISVGEYHTLALRHDGTVWAWGANGYGQIGNNTTTSAPLAVQVQTSGSTYLENVSSIAAGRLHSMAVTDDGTVYAWGDGQYGQQGRGDTASSIVAAAVPDMSSISKVFTSSSADHSFAVTVSGDVYGWGRSSSGQIGTGTTGYGNWVTSPSAVELGPAGSKVKSMATGFGFTLALLDDGTVWAAGSNSYGEFGVGAPTSTTAFIQTVTGVRGVAAGEDYGFFLKSDNKVYGSGANYDYKLGIAAIPPSEYPPSTSATPMELYSLTERGYQVDGYVRNAFGETPIAGAEVTLQSWHGTLSARTDANGYYRISDVLSEEDLEYSVSAPGYYASYGDGLTVSAPTSRSFYLDPNPDFSLHFYDTDDTNGTITGTAYWSDDYDAVGTYDLYFVNAAGEKIGTTPIATGPKYNGSGIVDGISIPWNAVGLRLFDGNLPTGAWIMLADNPGFEPQYLRGYDSNPLEGAVTPVIEWGPITEESSISHYQLILSSSNYETSGETVIGTYPAGSSLYSYPLTVPGYNPRSDVVSLRMISTSGQASILHEVNVSDAFNGDIVNYVPDDSVPSPSSVFFHDQDEATETIGGWVTWTTSLDSYTTRFQIYYVNADQVPIAPIGYIDRYFGTPHDFYIPEGTVPPSGAAGIAVLGVDYSEGETRIHSPINGSNYADLLADISDKASHLLFVDTDLDEGQIRGALTWEPAGNEEGLTGYAIVYQTMEGFMIGDGPVSIVAKGKAMEHEFTMDTTVDPLAYYLAVYSMSGETFSISDPYTHVEIDDHTMSEHVHYKVQFTMEHQGTDGVWDIADVVSYVMNHPTYNVDGMNEGFDHEDMLLLLQWLPRLTDLLE